MIIGRLCLEVQSDVTYNCIQMKYIVYTCVHACEVTHPLYSSVFEVAFLALSHG